MRDERNEEQIDTSSLLSSKRLIADKRKRGPIRGDTPSVIYAVRRKKEGGVRSSAMLSQKSNVSRFLMYILERELAPFILLFREDTELLQLR